MSLDVCRVCLAGNIKMYSIANTRLQDIYEKLTGNQWSKYKRPVTICYVCHSQLNRCIKFREMSKLSEEIFVRLIAGGYEFTEETVATLNKRKLQKMLVTPVETLTIGTILIDDTEVKVEIITNEELQFLPSLIQRKLQKLVVTPVEAWTSGTLSKDIIEVKEVQSIPIMNKNNLQKLLVTPVETWTSGTFSKDINEVEEEIPIESIPILNKIKLKKRWMIPVETWTIGTFSKDSNEVKNNKKEAQSLPILNKIKLKKRLVTPVETWTIGTLTKEATEVNEITQKEIQPTPNKIKLQKLLVTPVKTWTIGTLSNKSTEVEEEIQSIRHEKDLGETIEGTIQKNDATRHSPFKKGINLNRRSPHDGKMEICSNEDDSLNYRDEKSAMTPIAEPLVSITSATNEISDKYATVNTFKEKNKLGSTQESENKYVGKSTPCFTLKFKLQNKMSNRKTHFNTPMQSYTRKRAYPFDITNHE